MSAAHCVLLIAPVPESVRRSSSTSRAASWKTFQPAISSAPWRSSRVVARMGSTILIRKGSRGGRIVCKTLSRLGTGRSNEKLIQLEASAI